MKIFLSVLLIFGVTFLNAQTKTFSPPEVPIKVQAQKVKGKIVVDGILDEVDWNEAIENTEFFRIEPRQGGKVKYPSSVKVLFDQKNIYFGVFASDSMGTKNIRVQDLRRDFKWGENDIFAIQLDPQNLKQFCVSFQTTPYGSQRDMQVFNGSSVDNDWNALWKVRTSRTEKGYYAEFAIPFKSLRYNSVEPGDSTSWGINFMRLARKEWEQTVYPPIPQAFTPYRMAYAAQLVGLELPKKSANVRIEPYVLYNYEDKRYNTNPTNHTVKLGGDLKWAINPRSVFDLSINTDFAQADVDLAVNNLERFNIFFPERRQFFLENSGIWAGAQDRYIVPFFSRRIGLQGNFNALPAPIDIGSRFTSRNSKRAIASMYVHQRETENSQAAHFAIGRYLHNYGQENNVGIMLTHRLDQKSQMLGASQRNNSTLTVDGLIRRKNQLTISYMLSGSRDNSNDALGAAGKLFVGYNSAKFYVGYIGRFVTQEYKPAMGFVFQNNVVQHSPGGYFIWRPKNIPWIRRWDPGFFMYYYHDAFNPKGFQQANVNIFPVYISFSNGGLFQYSITPTWQNINFYFAPLGVQIEQGQYFYTRNEIKCNTDATAKISVSGNVDWGRFYNGYRTTIGTGLRFSPNVYAAFTADYEYNNLQELGINNTSLTTHLISLGARFAVNPRLQLSSFYQYNSFGKKGRLNLRLNWEYKPLSFVYFVYNAGQNNDLDKPFEQQFIAKVTMTKQF